MSTSISIQKRAVTKDDAIAIAGLLTQLNRVEGHHVVTNVAQLTAALFAHNARVMLRAEVAMRGAEMVGVALYYPGYDTLSATYGYHLADIVVEAHARRQGVGKLLFAQLAAQNLREGGQWISLTALAKNEAAQAFYHSLGMTQVAVHFFAAGPNVLSACAQLLQK